MTDEYSRPATVDDLLKVIKSLNEHDVPYILIGGYSLFVHGYHRATEDIDLLIPRDIKVGQKIKKALSVLKDKESLNLPDEWFEEGENIRLADEVVIDLLFNAAGESFESLKDDIEVLDVEGIKIVTLNLDGILKTKSGMREKDIADRLVLEKAINKMKE